MVSSYLMKYREILFCSFFFFLIYHIYSIKIMKKPITMTHFWRSSPLTPFVYPPSGRRQFIIPLPYTPLPRWKGQPISALWHTIPPLLGPIFGTARLDIRIYRQRYFNAQYVYFSRDTSTYTHYMLHFYRKCIYWITFSFIMLKIKEWLQLF